LPGVSDALLIHADSLLDANMFVATGITVGDPFTYLEAGDRRIIVTNQLEADLVRRESTANEIWMVDEFGGRDLVLDGWPLDEAQMETVRRMLERAGLAAAAVPPNFPLALADYLRGKGITLTPDRVLFTSRRRHKDADELQGVRAAQRATEAAFDAARGMIGSASPDAGGALELDGETLTCERVRATVVDTLRKRGCGGEPPIVAAGPQGALGHELGHGPIHAGVPVIIDIFPRHEASRYCADMTRTFCFGEATERLRAMHATILESLRRSTEAIAAGVPGTAPWEAACDVIERDGYRTVRGLGKGETLDEDFFHSLGHGVGVEVHEPPYMGLGDSTPLEQGDVVTVEPGVYRKDYGGVRLEDLVVVTADGCEVLTEYDYELEIRP
jgi:Xaa-Pro aminopeptidase